VGAQEKGFSFQPSLLYFLMFFYPCQLLVVVYWMLVLIFSFFCQLFLFFVGSQVSLVECLQEIVRCHCL
jgi:hypothetical protein